MNDFNLILLTTSMFFIAAGIFDFFRSRKELTPEEEEAEILRELERIGVFDYAKQQDIINRLQANKARQRIQKERVAGFNSGNSELDEALIEMSRYQNDLSLQGQEKFLQALQQYTRLVQELPPEMADNRQVEVNSPPTTSAKRIPCGYCSGLGHYVCRACHGIGRNRAIPSPNYTGNKEIDALLSIQHRRDSVCSGCHGQRKVSCLKCNGSGSQR